MPTLSPEELSALKALLRGQALELTVEGPTCTLSKGPVKRGQKCSKSEADLIKMAALNVPPTLLVSVQVMVAVHLQWWWGTRA